MIKTVSKNTDAQGLDYETLRLEGIRLIQKLCENVWTDFNPHDPGVTILEQIVYALTDLGYKASFDITSFLADRDGQINYRRQALYTREEVLRQFPVTIEDYERFFERELDCERVDFKVTEPGLYSVQLWPQESSTETKESLIGRFTALWQKWRNLGERVTQISVERNSQAQFFGSFQHVHHQIRAAGTQRRRNPGKVQPGEILQQSMQVHP